MGKSKKTQGKKSEVSSAKLSAPTPPVESETEKCRDRDELVWDKSECGLSEARMNEYLELTKHIPSETTRAILRDFGFEKAVEICQRSEVIPGLSPLEEHILLAAAPIYHAHVDSVRAIANQKHILSLVPHASPEAVRDFYNKLGRDDCLSPKNWTPKEDVVLSGINRLRCCPWVSEDNNSPLYEKPGRGLRSAPFVPEKSTPVKIGKKNNLAISMVGFDQNNLKKRDKSPALPPPRPLPFRLTSQSAKKHANQSMGEESPESLPFGQINRSNDRMSREVLPKRGRGTKKLPSPVEPDPPVPDFSVDIKPNETEEMSSLFSASMELTKEGGEKRINKSSSPFSIDFLLSKK